MDQQQDHLVNPFNFQGMGKTKIKPMILNRSSSDKKLRLDTHNSLSPLRVKEEHIA